MDTTTSIILSEFDTKKYIYESFSEKIHQLLTEIINEHNIHILSITKRVKERISLQKKLNKYDGKYNSLSDITDISGLRITTYFEDDVDKIAELIQTEFNIDKENSIDKRKLLDPDRFGYLSYHYIVSFSEDRLRLVEYKRFPGLKAEIQIRSILQHAWAEIEHDLGYKSTQSIPNIIKRRFSRLAGLFEIADQEFINIRNEIIKYEIELKEKISTSPETIFIDNSSMIEFIGQNETIIKIDKSIAKACNSKISPLDDKKSFDLSIKLLNYFGINYISELDVKLQQYRVLIEKFARLWLEKSKVESFSPGITIFYLGYILAAESGDINLIIKYLVHLAINPSNARSNAERILKTYTQISND